MKDFSLGDIVKISGYKNYFLVVSSNTFIEVTKMIQVCPFITGVDAGPLHIQAVGTKGTIGTAICEQIKLIDLVSRKVTKQDRIHYPDIMNISDAIQGIFEYD